MEAMVADWRQRWPAAFTKPVPLAAGFTGHMRAALRADGQLENRKSFGVAVHAWTMQGAYLYAVMRGERRRNLDGSEAELPTEEARQEAKRLLTERAARRAAREQAKQQAAAKSCRGTPTPSASDAQPSIQHR
jgi:sRNA-binding protein